MRRLLVIAYYFPPMGLSGVQRIAKFVKYLPAYGWAPTVLTVEPGGYFAFDEHQLEELQRPEISIERTRVIDPTRLFNKGQSVALPAESSRRLLSSLSQFFFVPDNKIGWYRPATRRAVELHASQPFDCILATCPPYTNALIARSISKQCHIPYMLDFRDDWLENPRHQYTSRLHKMAHKSMERSCFRDATSIVTINDRIAHAMHARHPGLSEKIGVLHQGFDPEDFDMPPSPLQQDTLVFLYSGVFYDVQKPDYFLRALSLFLEAYPAAREQIEVRFLGILPAESKKLIDSLGIKDLVYFGGYRSHAAVVQAIREAHILWLTVGSGPGQEMISTSKLFEYIGSQKPILGLVPEGAARDTLLSYGASFLAYPENVDEIKAQLHKIYDRWSKQQLPVPSEANVQPYNRKAITGLLADRLNTMMAKL